MWDYCPFVNVKIERLGETKAAEEKADFIFSGEFGGGEARFLPKGSRLAQL